MSGRALRRLPVLALARYIGMESGFSNSSVSQKRHGTPTADQVNGYGTSMMHKSLQGHPNPVGAAGTTVEVWLDAMEKVIAEQANEHARLL
jgi:hypothetical protein